MKPSIDQALIYRVMISHLKFLYDARHNWTGIDGPLIKTPWKSSRSNEHQPTIGRHSLEVLPKLIQRACLNTNVFPHFLHEFKCGLMYIIAPQKKTTIKIKLMKSDQEPIRNHWKWLSIMICTFDLYYSNWSSNLIYNFRRDLFIPSQSLGIQQ